MADFLADLHRFGPRLASLSHEEGLQIATALAGTNEHTRRATA